MLGCRRSIHKAMGKFDIYVGTLINFTLFYDEAVSVNDMMIIYVSYHKNISEKFDDMLTSDDYN